VARLLLFANTAWYLYNFRLGLARAARDAGHEVIFAGPSDDYVGRIQEAGFAWHPLELSRRGMNPITETGAVLTCARLYRQLQPDLVHHFTIKPVVYGSLAARLTGVRRVADSITGLGYTFMKGGASGWLLRRLAVGLYRTALRGPLTRALFENRDDLEFFVWQHIVRREQAVVVRGTGVDLAQFKPSPEPPGEPVVVLASRMLWDKGVGEYVEAARELKKARVPGRFVLVGTTDPGNPSSIGEDQLRAWAAEGVIEWLGRREDMPSIYAGSSIAALPSAREGLPRTLVEAAASARPIVATDVPGCREVVQNEVNGLLVPPGDPAALAAAIGRLLRDPQLRRSMGEQGRLLVERELADGPIHAAILAVYRELLRPADGAVA
jgi:glycosyltransferase involved in cell wall biosynthesis